MKKNCYPRSRNENIILQEVDGDLLIFDLVSNKAYCLNETSAIVWKSCDGEKSVEDIAHNLGREMKAKVGEDVVWLSLKELESANLLVNPVSENKFAGLTRRQIIKEIGFAAMIALPLISAVVVPSSTEASQAFCNCFSRPGMNARLAGCACMQNSDCCGVCIASTMTCSVPVASAQPTAAMCCPPLNPPAIAY